MSEVAILPNARLNRRTGPLITAIFSALCYGGWAYLANEGAEGRLFSTAVHLVGSFFVGYFLLGFVESVFAKMSAPWRYPVSAIVPYWTTLLIFAGVHYLAGTAEIYNTLLPNFSIGTLYLLAHCNKLEKSVY